MMLELEYDTMDSPRHMLIASFALLLTIAEVGMAQWRSTPIASARMPGTEAGIGGATLGAAKCKPEWVDHPKSDQVNYRFPSLGVSLGENEQEARSDAKARAHQELVELASTIVVRVAGPGHGFQHLVEGASAGLTFGEWSKFCVRDGQGKIFVEVIIGIDALVTKMTAADSRLDPVALKRAIQADALWRATPTRRELLLHAANPIGWWQSAGKRSGWGAIQRTLVVGGGLTALIGWYGAFHYSEAASKELSSQARRSGLNERMERYRTANEVGLVVAGTAWAIGFLQAASSGSYQDRVMLTPSGVGVKVPIAWRGIVP